MKLCEVPCSHFTTTVDILPRRRRLRSRLAGYAVGCCRRMRRLCLGTALALDVTVDAKRWNYVPFSYSYLAGGCRIPALSSWARCPQLFAADGGLRSEGGVRVRNAFGFLSSCACNKLEFDFFAQSWGASLLVI